MIRLALPIAAAITLAACGSPSSLGVVVGGVQPCSGLPLPNQPTYAAATVTVLQGSVSWRYKEPGMLVAVLPTTVAARATTVTNGTYDFHLKPGHYVLRAVFPYPSNVYPWAEVDVAVGATTHKDIPNGCV